MKDRAGKALFIFTVFFSAFLLFQIQPIIAKIILPWFGGSASVWTTCNVFFQVILLIGYGYSHLLVSKTSINRQTIIHILLCTAALFFIQIYPKPVALAEATTHPISTILLLLTTYVSIPFFILTCTSSLAQSWYYRAGYGNPYPLFAVSNFGSLLSLALYPFAIEPYLTLHQQVTLWTWSFGIFILLMAITAYISRNGSVADQTTPQDNIEEKPDWKKISWWFLLAFLASGLFLGFTNHICHDVAVIPLLWIAPLAIYLLTFVISFSAPDVYKTTLYAFLFIILAATYDMPSIGDISTKIKLSLIALFVGCMISNGELYKSRPKGKNLTLFYFILSIGGAAGGMFVSFIAPNIFDDYWELPIFALTTSAVSFLLIFREGIGRKLYLAHPHKCIILGIILFAAMLRVPVGRVISLKDSVYNERNFYGTLSVEEDPYTYKFVGGRKRILYGLQVKNPAYKNIPTSYYHHESGIGEAITYLKQHETLRVGAIGLGVGTIAAYGRQGDHFKFYEINPAVIPPAQKYFTFLSNSNAKIEIKYGDGRLAMETEPHEQFNLILVDAFTGDSVPIHLLTTEALRLYLHHLTPDGILAIHISNRYINLIPPIALLAQENHLWGCFIEKKVPEGHPYQHLSQYILLSRKPIPELEKKGVLLHSSENKEKIWTDHYSSWFPYMK